MTDQPAWANRWGQDFLDWWDSATDDERRAYLRHVPAWEHADTRHPSAIATFGTGFPAYPWRDMTLGLIKRAFPRHPLDEPPPPDDEEYVRLYDKAKNTTA